MQTKKFCSFFTSLLHKSVNFSRKCNWTVGLVSENLHHTPCNLAGPSSKIWLNQQLQVCKMASDSRTGGDLSCTGPREKLPEIVRRTAIYFFTHAASILP